MTVERRAVLLAGVGGAAGLAALVAGCGSDGPTAGTSISGSFVSRRRRGARTGWTVLYPPGHDRARLPVLIALHGRTGNHTDSYTSLHLDQYLARAVAHGTRPFAIASVDGGDAEYWHPRRTTDPAGMVIHEFLPLLGGKGLRVGRVALLGWSMGGYGALYLGSVLGSRHAAAVVAESPAVWHHSDQCVEGSFDDAADFDAHSIVGNRRRLDRLAQLPLRIDCGDRDGFAPVTRDLRASLRPTPRGGSSPAATTRPTGAARRRQLAFVGRHF